MVIVKMSLEWRKTLFNKRQQLKQFKIEAIFLLSQY
jgi:hypothetical protein